MEQLRSCLKDTNDGDRQMVKILTAVTVDGLDAVEIAVAEALAQGVTFVDYSPLTRLPCENPA
jgi:hypothetical protein